MIAAGVSGRPGNTTIVHRFEAMEHLVVDRKADMVLVVQQAGGRNPCHGVPGNAEHVPGGGDIVFKGPGGVQGDYAQEGVLHEPLFTKTKRCC